MTRVLISEITLADDVNIREELRDDVVERYAEILDDLPPVELWRTNGKLLLSDGWHRIAAARRKGRAEIDAEIHEGDRTEAIVAAIVANTHHGLPLSTAERNAGIVRLKAAGWRPARIARELGLSHTRVRGVLEESLVPANLPHAGEVIKAPREYRLPLAEAADVGGWSQQQVRQLARDLSDPTIPDEDKAQAIAAMGARTEDGRLGVPVYVVASVLDSARRKAAAPAIYTFVSAGQTVIERLALDPDPFVGFDVEALRRLRADLRGIRDLVDHLVDRVEDVLR